MIRDGDGLALMEPGDDFAACVDALAPSYPHEFVIYPGIDPDAVEAAAMGGFMPMAAALEEGLGLLTPKLHLSRCLADTESIHATRTARRESARYGLSANKAFEKVIDGCLSAHGDGWLLPELVGCFKFLHERRFERKAAFISFELWIEDGTGRPELAAGEFGYLIGSAYASLSGYYAISGAGTVQLAATASALRASGIRVWDLGMELEYKRSLGAIAYPRAAFIETLRKAYSTIPDRDLRAETDIASARSLIDGAASLIGRAIKP